MNTRRPVDLNWPRQVRLDLLLATGETLAIVSSERLRTYEAIPHCYEDLATAAALDLRVGHGVGTM